MKSRLEGIEIEKDEIRNLPIRTLLCWLKDDECEFYRYGSHSAKKEGYMHLWLKGEIEGKRLWISTEDFPECEEFCTYQHYDVEGFELDGDYEANRQGLIRDITTHILSEEYIPEPKKEEKKGEKKYYQLELVMGDKKFTVFTGKRKGIYAKHNDKNQ